MIRPELILAGAATCLLAGPVLAAEAWQPPHKESCSLAPGKDCGADVKCPADKPFVLGGGGGIPKISDPNHRLAMTMNVAISPNAWRVRWRNMGSSKVDATVMIRALCSDDGKAWGK